MRADAPPARTLRVTFVQPSIPQTLIWDSGNDAARFRDLIRLSEAALTNAADLLLWPEAAVPSFARWDTNVCGAITNFVRRHRVWLILGSDDVGVPANPKRPDEYEYYNASFLVNPEGEFVSRYKKRNLVIFGEYVPLQRALPFLQWFTPIQGGFTPGNRVGFFDLKDRQVRTSVLICFEDVFPWLARESADPDIDFLVNLTNNGWFGEGAAQWQHAAAAIFRAVENGLPLLRCSNNGLTCWVDRRGRLRQVLHDDQGNVYRPGCLTADIPLLPPGETRAPTFYHRHGDWFGWSCAGVTALLLLARLRPSRASGASPSTQSPS
jgi:apolipoprotein N-acyltransferase